MSIAVEACEKKYSPLPRRTGRNQPYAAAPVPGSERDGVHAKTRALLRSGTQRLREKTVPGDARDEVITSCVADAQGIAPKLFDAWFATNDNTTHLVMEDFEMGTLSDVLAGEHALAYYEEVDLAMAALYARLVEGGTVCHYDPHPGNVVFRRRAGTLQARMIDFGIAGRDGRCDIRELWIFLLRRLPKDKLRLLPKMAAMVPPDAYIDLITPPPSP